jgi:hypothetical protein
MAAAVGPADRRPAQVRHGRWAASWIRSERLLLEQLHYNLLYRWFVGLSPDDGRPSP